MGPVHIAQSTSEWVAAEHGIPVLDLPANSPDLNFHRGSMGYCLEEDERPDQQYRRSVSLYQSNLQITSMPHLH